MRIRNFALIVLGWFVLWLAQVFFGRSIEEYMERHNWHKLVPDMLDKMPAWVTEMSSALPLTGFWAGVFLTLAIWGLFEVYYALRRRHSAFAKSGTAPLSWVADQDKIEVISTYPTLPEHLKDVDTSVAPSPPTVAVYSKDDVMRLLDALHEARGLLNGEPVAIQTELHAVREHWLKQIVGAGPTSYVDAVNKVIRRINDFRHGFDHEFLKKHAHYRHEVWGAMRMDKYPERIGWGLCQFTALVNRLPTAVPLETVKLLDEQHKKYVEEYWAAWREWLSQANSMIDRVTESLRRSGTTGLGQP